MADRTHLWPGVPMALTSAALFGACAPLSKLLLGSVDPWLLAGVLYLGAGVGLAALAGARHSLGLASSEAPLRRTDLPWLIAMVASGGLAAPVLLMFGLSMTSAASGSLLLNLEGLATMGIAWLAFRENVDRRLMLGAAAIIAGAVVLSWRGEGAQLDIGGFMIVGACLAWGIDNNLSRRLPSADPMQIAMIKGLAAGATNLILALALGAQLPGWPVLIGGAVVGFVGIGLSLVLFMLGLRHLGAARTGAYFSLAPFIGAVVAVAMFREPITLQLLAAGVLMAVGLLLHLAEQHQHEHTHEVLEHDHAHVHDEHHQHAHDGPISEPHTHWHRHEPLRHSHAHYPDLHHRHRHG